MIGCYSSTTCTGTVGVVVVAAGSPTARPTPLVAAGSPTTSPTRLPTALPASLPTTLMPTSPTPQPSFSPYTYFGSFFVSAGPSWATSPPTYTCQQACALLFGGVYTNWAGSTSNTTLTRTCNYVSQFASLVLT